VCSRFYERTGLVLAERFTPGELSLNKLVVTHIIFNQFIGNAMVIWLATSSTAVQHVGTRSDEAES
jgi:hypothetical protein